MQRFSAFLSLMIFIVVFSLVAQSFQEELPPLRGKEKGPVPDLELLQKEEISLPEIDEPTPPVNNSYPGTEKEAEQEEPELIPSDEEELLVELTESKTNRVKAADLHDAVHFLLVARDWNRNGVDYITLVTLAPGSHAHLTAVDPAVPLHQAGGSSNTMGDLIAKGSSYADLLNAAEEITGLPPRFYIDLSLTGFITLIEMLVNSETASSAALKKTADTLKPDLASLQGEDVMQYLTDPAVSTTDKEALIIMLLITARDIQDTSLGLRLLWTGYKNLRTDLGLSHLLEIRKITQKISPTKVKLQEITP